MNKNEIELINEVELLHEELMNLKKSKEYLLGKKIIKFKIIDLIVERILRKKNNKYPIDYYYEEKKYSNNYNKIKQKKIAIYTCITGDYDDVQEPLFCNENVDYILFTNNNKLTSSKWKIIKINNKDNLNNILLNRYVKMHPHEFLQNYDYSIYIDGNIKLYSDLTSYINRINNEYGIAFHKHSYRNKLSSELKACKILKKGNIDLLEKQINNYYKQGMPDDFGLVEATIIACDLKSSKAKRVLKEWWDEFIKSKSLRDQISIPYILYKNNISINEISTLGNNIVNNPKFEIINHKKEG